MGKELKELIEALLEYSMKMDELIKAFVESTNEVNEKFNERMAKVKADKKPLQ